MKLNSYFYIRNKVTNNLNKNIMKVLEIKTDNLNSHSVRIEDKKIKVWFDVWRENETNDFESDWNAYIFDNRNIQDMELKAYQENCNNFIKCSELAIEAIEHNLTQQFDTI